MLRGINEELALPIMQPRKGNQGKPANHPSVKDKIVVVTGAGGSIGSELSIQIARQNPKHLILIDNSEHGLYEVNCTITENFPDLKVSPLLVDIRDASGVHYLFYTYGPEILFHAAALKHVPMLENEYNFLEAVRTNVLGSDCLAKTCATHGTPMIHISTDKAVNPTSAMGLTKRAAELVTRHRTGSLGGRISQVRFGNVFGSSGSVVPLFRRQIAQGGPVTVTHRDMTRYMMTIKQAVGLVLDAADAAEAAPSRLYVLDMGEPVKIMDLAHQLIRQSGLEPETDIEIQITGIRPGEKLYEELFYPSEKLVPTDLTGITACDLTNEGLPDIQQEFMHLVDSVNRRAFQSTLEILRFWTPEYIGDGIR